MISLARHRAFIIASRDAIQENEITPIDVHSVEWSDRSVPVQKRSGVVVNVYKRDTVRERTLVSWFYTHPIGRAFPVRWLRSGFSLDQQS